MVERRDALLRLPAAELDDLFRRSTPGALPVGLTDGTAIIAVGVPLRRAAAWLVRAVAWQGKVFDAEGQTLQNRVGPTGALMVGADVYVGDSWLDGRPAIVIDYSRHAHVARGIRDEIRLVDEGLYLGLVYGAGRRIPGVWFALHPPA